MKTNHWFETMRRSSGTSKLLTEETEETHLHRNPVTGLKSLQQLFRCEMVYDSEADLLHGNFFELICCLILKKIMEIERYEVSGIQFDRETKGSSPSTGFPW